LLRCLYVDLDGTLLGRGASLLHDGEGAFTLIGVRALEACARADVEVVLYSGRRRAQVFEDSRIIGTRAYIFEAGSGLVLEGELHWLTGGLVPNERTIFEQISDSGAPALLLDRYAGRLEYHTPWHVDREVSHLFRGMVDPAEAHALLAAEGIENLRLVDNGTIPHHATLPDIERPRAYHLIPAAASKAGAVATHMRARGYARDDVVAVGDSREDMGAAAAVGTFWLVRNALERDPTLADDIARYGNVRVAEETFGAGVYEAVVTTLAEGR
jgi:phosphoglycolate phosphatase